MPSIKVKTPAKINLTLEIVGKSENGFHEIKSIMSAINLYDYLTFEIEPSKNNKNEIFLSGNNPQIPYNENNLVYKAINLFCEAAKITNKKFKIYIEKHIPVEAGLAGGSTNAAGAFYALNEIFKKPLNDDKINELCAKLGSDLNFCLKGGCCLCEGRGEKITPLKPVNLPICLIKPKNFGISAKEAYSKFARMPDKPKPVNTQKLQKLIQQGLFDEKLLVNHLEMAVIDDYPILKKIKTKTNSMMSGSGPTMFCLSDTLDTVFNDDILVIEGLKTIPHGIEVLN